jgi:uncharacterized membrane protein YkvI
MSAMASQGPSWFQRFLLPGFAFKAVVIGGGYATGRELAEFFLGSGPRGGLMAMLLVLVIWSAVCAVTFMLARAISAYDYRTFFKALLGPFWILFEASYILLLILILAVLAAAAGTIGQTLLGWPGWMGTALLLLSIIAVTSFGNEGAEGLFRYTSTFIYLVYAAFVMLAFTTFGDRIGTQLAAPVPTDGWVIGGITYASYNVIGAVAILPFLRHFTSQRDALVAGLLSGPLAIVPALLFFLCMIAFYPEVGGEALPSDFLLRQIGAPWFHYLFQAMIFCALLETGVGIVNGLNERVDSAYRARRGVSIPVRARVAITAFLVIASGVLAGRFGLVALIAGGYSFFGYIMVFIYVLPLLTIGVYRLAKRSSRPPKGDVGPA